MTKGTSLAGLVVLAATSFTNLATAQRRPAGASDEPMSRSWPVTRSWDAPAEAEYGRWVQTIGRAVEAHRCNTLSACLDSPAINPLYVPGRALTFRADCADVPYILRAYFAWRHHLPFVHTTDRRGSTVRESAYATPRRLLQDIGSTVHSGLFRTSPDREDTDTYPVCVDRGAIHPGTTFFDPDGHVLVVYDVPADGAPRLIDGHPGGSFTARRFSAQQTLGSSRQGGGFRNFRPVLVRPDGLTRPRNAELADYDPMVQHDPARWVVRGRSLGYHDWVRARLGDGARP